MAKRFLGIEFSEDSYDQLVSLRGEMGVDALEDVVRDALAYLLWSRGQVTSGNQLYVGGPDASLELRQIRLKFVT